jgi:hypothetical protein
MLYLTTGQRMKTKLTLSMSKEVIIKAKQKCLELGMTLSEVVEKALKAFTE